MSDGRKEIGRERNLWIGEEVKSLLVSGIGLLEVILHEVTVTLIVVVRKMEVDREGRGHTECAPYFAVVFLESKNTLEVIDRLKIDITSLRDLIERIRENGQSEGSAENRRMLGKNRLERSLKITGETHTLG